MHCEGANSKPSPRAQTCRGKRCYPAGRRSCPLVLDSILQADFSPHRTMQTASEANIQAVAEQPSINKSRAGLKARVLWAWVWRLPSTRPPLQRAISTSVSAAAAPGAGFSLFGWLQVREAQSSAERPRRRAPLEHGPANKQCCDANASLLPHATLGSRARRASER
jgi:hypothetical protein